MSICRVGQISKASFRAVAGRPVARAGDGAASACPRVGRDSADRGPSLIVSRRRHATHVAARAKERSTSPPRIFSHERASRGAGLPHRPGELLDVHPRSFALPQRIVHRRGGCQRRTQGVIEGLRLDLRLGQLASEQQLDEQLGLTRQQRRLVEQVEELVGEAKGSRGVQRRAVREPPILACHFSGLARVVIEDLKARLE
mmetsp:Transcript_33892/g.57889  ORF Transcript_33892/g.57889 Transcript_33892/m.57889 type:complete len:200 (-) Transcript_33892:828-1427(-)